MAVLWIKNLVVLTGVLVVRFVIVMPLLVRMRWKLRGLSQVKKVIGWEAWESRVIVIVGGKLLLKLWVLGDMERVSSMRGGGVWGLVSAILALLLLSVVITQSFVEMEVNNEWSQMYLIGNRCCLKYSKAQS
jgi:hypothetical protein